jgi:hypothetical protein
MVDRKEKSLGYFNEFDDAVKARTAAERKYFGQYSMTASRITASHHSGV